MSIRASVPCNGCKACCSQAVFLYPEHGDVVGAYRTVEAVDPITGKWSRMLDHKDNGECCYLGPDGCTIYDAAPTVCRTFDCRRFVAKYTRNERRKLIRDGVLSPDIVAAGLARMATL